MPELRVVPVGSATDAARGGFRGLPARVYAGDPVWVPRSDDVVDERFRAAAAGLIDFWPIVVTDDGVVVARAAAIVEPAQGDAPEGWIGLFECLPDATGAGVLALRACVEWLTSRGVRRLTAPRTDAVRAGLLVEGFALPQTVLTAHNPPYYAEVFTRAGLEPTTRMAAFTFGESDAPPAVLGARGLGVVDVRSARVDDLHREVSRAHAFQRALFAGSPGHVVRDEARTGLLARDLLPLIDPDLVLFAETRAPNDAPVRSAPRHPGADEVDTVGLLLCLPDAWQRAERVDRARLISVGVAPGWRGRGVATAMAVVLAERLLAKGYRELEASWILESNAPPQRLARALGGRLSRTFAMFGADLA